MWSCKCRSVAAAAPGLITLNWPQQREPVRRVLSCDAQTPSAPLLIGYGNPTVDATVQVTRQELAALGLAEGTEMAGASSDAKRKIVRQVLQDPRRELTPGGAALNSMRVAKWTAGSAIRCAYLGAVGKDEYAAILRRAMKDVDVTSFLLEVDGEPTSVCAALVDIETRDRTLAVVRGAAGCISSDILERQDVQQALQDAVLIYVISFAITTPERAALATKLAGIAVGRNMAFALNLSSAGLLPNVHEIVMSLLPMCRYVFCNEGELKAFATLQGWEVSQHDLSLSAQRLADLTGPGGVAVITQGSQATLVAEQGRPAFSILVPPVPKAEIVDTNGCGDSFVGGFLAKVIQGASLNQAVDEGHRCAGQILRRQGCDLTY